jgi:hypothetical protein
MESQMWSNKKPKKDGVHWYVKKVWKNGLISRIKPPQICHVSAYKEDITILFIGDDCPDGVPDGETMVVEYSRSEEPIFMFDTPEDKERKSKNITRIKEEVWLKKVEEPEFKE